MGGEAVTPEEKAVIAQALRWSRGWVDDRTLQLAVQALKVSRQPEQGPDPIPCMVRAEHSATMFCILPKGHDGSEPETYGGTWGWSYHEGIAGGTPPRGGGRRQFKVVHDLSRTS